jgi:hypothetical protein|tara:strand:+ start:1089 stop:1595 length:507 start_codon:yes stop_codon:yes gene_type:complete
MANLTTNLNYLQPTSYKITIDRENYPNLEYFAQSITHPGMILNPVEMPFRQVAGVPFAGSSLTYNELSITLILDENLTGYGEMYEWLRRALTVPEVKSLRRNFVKKTIPTYSDIMLSILSSHNNKTKQISYKECVPTSLGDIQFESTATGTEFITFGVTFRFSYFDLV